MHLKDGEIRAYQDGETSEESRSRVEAHLASCAACRERQEQLYATAGEAAHMLARLTPSPKVRVESAGAARLRMGALIAEKEKYMKQNRWYVRYRPALIATGLVLILGISLAFAPVRAIANSFLGLFRVQQVQVVAVDPGNLPEQLANSYQLEYFMSHDMQINQQGEEQEVATAEEAGERAGIPVRLPPGMNGPQHLYVSSSAQVNFTVDLKMVEAVLAEIGRGDISLPPEIDGAEVTVDLPAMVSASYGDCAVSSVEGYPEGYDPDEPKMAMPLNCTTLVQMASPEVNAPEGLDLNTLGQAYLQLLGMAPDEAAQFSENIDWATTLVIPMPMYVATYQTVDVDGARGTLILGNEESDQQYVLIWIKNDIVYVLNGQGSADTAVRLANSIR